MTSLTLLDRVANEVLSTIEFEEEEILNWGFVQGTIDEDEIALAIEKDEHLQNLALWQDAQDKGICLEDILENLIERRLIFQVGDAYYTRFAETIRLLRLLRQRWSYKDWDTAKKLVSDYRINLKRRRYPRRDISFETLIKRLDVAGISEIQKEATTALLHRGHGEYFNLAQFQVNAVLQLFQDTEAKTDRGLVIGAGTGAGKTKAFYLPALATIVANLNDTPHVQLLAIYPRIELLRDQLKEAYTESRKLDGIGQHPIKIGAYYGKTPASSSAFANKSYERGKWKAVDEGFICPYLECPDCEQEENDNQSGGLRQYPLLWLHEDIEAQNHRLFCPNCGEHVVDESTLLLTRQQMRDGAPDILFTTTEMLNRKLGNSGEHQLFGIGATIPPTFLLLDEVHTYHSINGAQIAYLLRRWRLGRTLGDKKRPLCIVGLSATLLDADTFFAKLTGLSLDRQMVAYIEPSENELINEGIEYNLVLKGDAGSGAQFLSTTVQTMMLMGRMQDQEESRLSKGAWGVKIFGFTDNLDVINRWRYILEDAERHKRLAQFRQNSDEYDNPRLVSQSGQLWRTPQDIGHNLENSLRIGRTTSQDAGFDANAELVLATATLEVGFNDPTVGAVVQHKAPHNMASFRQRKGRAGRQRGMRPWMVVVTSSYGRDRWAFHNAQELFNPTLKPAQLPLANDYVRKIQATYALLDWITWRLAPKNGYIDTWQELSNNGKPKTWDYHRKRIKKLLESAFTSEGRDALAQHISQALNISRAEADILLWREPRSILFQVIPTILRQLESLWATLDEVGKSQPWTDALSPQSIYPLPEFLPSALFSDLNLPELVIEYPRYRDRQSGEIITEAATMTLQQGLREYAPGRANKRYSLTVSSDQAHWLEVPLAQLRDDNSLSIHAFDVQFDAYHEVTIDDTIYQVFRPLYFSVAEIPDEVKSSSYGEFIWQSVFEPDRFSINDLTRTIDEQDIIPFAPHLQWSHLLEQATVYTQSAGTWVNVTRFAHQARMETKFEERGRPDERYQISFAENDGHAQAFGFQVGVDGIAFFYRPFDIEQATTHTHWSDIARPLKSRFFQAQLRHDKRLVHLSPFTVDWLAQLHIMVVTSFAVIEACSLTKASVEAENNYLHRMQQIMHFVFQSQTNDDDITGLVPIYLLDELSEPLVQQALFDHFTIFTGEKDKEFQDWLIDCHASSLAATIYTVILRWLPEIATPDLVVDVDTFNHIIWLTETSIGGIGVIEMIAEKIVAYPREFDMHLQNSLEHCEREDLAQQFATLAPLIKDGSSAISAAFSETREAKSLRDLSHLQAKLSTLFVKNNIYPTRQLFVELNGKMLRPNSDSDTDHLIAKLVEAWQHEEARLGIRLELNIFSVVACHLPEIMDIIDKIADRISWGDRTAYQTFTTIQSMLWLTCADSCSDCIDTYNPFHVLTKPSRPLVKAILQPHDITVEFEEENWYDKVRDHLEKSYQVEILCQHEMIASCKKALIKFLLSPIDTGYQLFYPSIDRIFQAGNAWKISVVIDELLGG